MDLSSYADKMIEEINAKTDQVIREKIIKVASEINDNELVSIIESVDKNNIGTMERKLNELGYMLEVDIPKPKHDQVTTDNGDVFFKATTDYSQSKVRVWKLIGED